jgi:hypothetical protein
MLGFGAFHHFICNRSGPADSRRAAGVRAGQLACVDSAAALGLYSHRPIGEVSVVDPGAPSLDPACRLVNTATTFFAIFTMLSVGQRWMAGIRDEMR